MSGVSAMVSSNASTAVRSLCRQHSWPLNLDPGQNQFTITVSASQARFRQQQIPYSHHICTGTMSGKKRLSLHSAPCKSLLPSGSAMRP